MLCCVLCVSSQKAGLSEEYEIYDAWLSKITFIGPESAPVFIMGDTLDHDTDFSQIPEHRKRQLSGLQASTLRNYRQRNKTPVALEAGRFTSRKTVRIIPESYVTFMRSGAAHEDFVRKSGAEFGVALSRVGFNEEKNQALLHVNFRNIDDPKYAFGYYFLYSKVKGEWLLKQYGISWEY